ncbi:helix-turn-helix transcriptional regulator [Flammeovirga agarivorans]|uniref:Helix-turn-helix transcriptional regulator n=1 Tax=Flammeovirga agarivorans TaxID=2726742 RepID=A0A7X8XVA4_9BACT|nr:AraC family transcriptional regulator [Flammeovirga agarivorans]NLR90890.1 helix-turn-helix transcriptional regulator [Flammeovirga agarivorans]
MINQQPRILYFDATSFDNTYKKLQKDVGGDILDHQFIGNTEIGEIHLENFDIQSGFKVSVNRVLLNQDVVVQSIYDHNTPHIYITFLRKNSKLRVQKGNEETKTIANGGAQFSIILHQGQRGMSMDMKKDEEVSWIGVRLKRDDFQGILGIPDIETGHFFEKLINHIYYEESTPELEDIIEEIFQIQKTTIARNAIIFGKGLELTGKLLKKMMLRLHSKKEKKINKHDMSTYFKIKDYILSDYSNIPTTQMISHQFGIGETKLKEEFKQIFDQSIFAFITSHRMMDAHRLIRMTELTIGEIGTKVGYNHLSKFTSAFKRYYDYTPTELRKSLTL